VEKWSVIAVADEEPCPAAAVFEVRDEFPGGLCRPGGGRVRGGAQDADAPAGVPDHREHVQPRPGQGDRFEEVTRQRGISLGAQKVRPGAGTPLGYRFDPRLLQGLTPTRCVSTVSTNGLIAEQVAKETELS
jgi:hypothetical protein